jgi:hypothetical protein
MGNTYKVTLNAIPPASAVEFNFPALDNLHNGRYALTMSTGSSLKDYSVWHVAGTVGNTVADLGYIGNTLIATALYAGEYAATLALYESDKASMNLGPCTIVDTAGNTHNRCRLKDSREQSPPKGYSIGASTFVFITVTYIFDQHGA